MFDDINVNSPGQAPKNLPISEPDDIFASTDTPPDVNQTSAVSVGKLQPKVESPKPLEPSISELSGEPKVQTMPEELSNLNRVKSPSLAKNMMILAIVLIGVGVLAGGSWLVYTMFVKPAEGPGEFVLPEDLEGTQKETGQKAEEKTQPGNVQEAQIDDSVLFGEQTDTDADNLTNNKEAELGTNPNNWDSDGDGVSDGDEVLVWKSDPLNRDTDGDTFWDGAEIKNGYNPVGPGKIFDIPKQ